jgi:hypothetical protein
MATRELTGTTPFGMGRAAVAGMVAVVAGLVATIIVAAAILIGSSASSGTYTLGPSDDWGTRHRGAVPAAAAASSGTYTLGRDDDWITRQPSTVDQGFTPGQPPGR